MGNIWVTSDLHLGHEKVAQLRGFDSSAHHDLAILNKLKKANRPGDTWYLLGDLVMGSFKQELLCELSASLRDSEVHIILGNHDRPHPCNRSAHRYLKEWVSLFDSVSTGATIRYGGRTYLMSHFPYNGEGSGRAQEERYTQWRLRDEGKPLIHGHTHDTYRRTLSALGTEQNHCGLDAWDLGPVNVHDLLAD